MPATAITAPAPSATDVRPVPAGRSLRAALVRSIARRNQRERIRIQTTTVPRLRWY